MTNKLKEENKRLKQTLRDLYEDSWFVDNVQDAISMAKDRDSIRHASYLINLEEDVLELIGDNKDEK